MLQFLGNPSAEKDLPVAGDARMFATKVGIKQDHSGLTSMRMDKTRSPQIS